MRAKGFRRSGREDLRDSMRGVDRVNLYVMVGGQGRRLGQDKPGLLVGDYTILAQILRVVRGLFDAVYLVGGDGERARGLGLHHLVDARKDAGPLGGIAAALRHAHSEPAFIMAGDMPFVSRPLIRHMLDAAHGLKEDALVPCHGGYVEPLFAIYRPTCLPAIKALMAAQRRKVTAFYDDISCKDVPEEVIRAYGHPRVLFFNVNTPADRDLTHRLAGPHHRGVLRSGRSVPVFCVTGWSGVGKTHWLSRLITAYRSKGLQVAAVKHAVGGFRFDRFGTDTAHFAASGAAAVAVTGPQGWALMERCAASLDDIIARLDGVDVVIGEGFSGETWPKVEVVVDPTSLRTPTALGFVGRGPRANAPFPYFSEDQLPGLVAHLNLILEIENGGDTPC